MLILTRHPEESILIGSDIEVFVYDYHPPSNSTKIGIMAPPNVDIIRREIAETSRPTQESLDRRQLAGILKKLSHDDISDLIFQLCGS